MKRRPPTYEWAQAAQPILDTAPELESQLDTVLAALAEPLAARGIALPDRATVDALTLADRLRVAGLWEVVGVTVRALPTFDPAGIAPADLAQLLAPTDNTRSEWFASFKKLIEVQEFVDRPFGASVEMEIESSSIPDRFGREKRVRESREQKARLNAQQLLVAIAEERLAWPETLIVRDAFAHRSLEPLRLILETAAVALDNARDSEPENGRVWSGKVTLELPRPFANLLAGAFETAAEELRETPAVADKDGRVGRILNRAFHITEPRRGLPGASNIQIKRAVRGVVDLMSYGETKAHALRMVSDANEGLEVGTLKTWCRGKSKRMFPPVWDHELGLAVEEQIRAGRSEDDAIELVRKDFPVRVLRLNTSMGLRFQTVQQALQLARQHLEEARELRDRNRKPLKGSD